MLPLIKMMEQMYIIHGKIIANHAINCFFFGRSFEKSAFRKLINYIFFRQIRETVNLTSEFLYVVQPDVYL